MKILDEIDAILRKYGEAPEYGESCETSYTKLLNCLREMERRIVELEAEINQVASKPRLRAP